MATPTDIQEVIHRFNGGDHEAFGVLYRQYYRPLLYFTLKIVGQQDDAQDIVTESMIKLWQRREAFHNAAQLKAFLFTTSRNAAINSLRGRKIHQSKEVSIAEQMGEETAFFDKLVLTELIQRVAAEVENLPASPRAVFKLSYFEGLETQEIAELLGMTPAAVYTNRKRALQALRIIFKNTHPTLYLAFIQLF